LESAPAYPRVTLKSGREKSLRHRHPWVFSGAIEQVEGAPQAGDTVALFARDGGFLGTAAYNPQSPIRARVWEPWASAIAEIAASEHVVCKLSGLLTEADPSGWREDELLRYAERVVESFGPARMMYGSDWPVLILAGEYEAWYRFTRRVTRDWSPAETLAFYRDNAVDFYRL
jgi:L-fuconolactonase